MTKRDDDEGFTLYVLIVCVFALAACVLGAWVTTQISGSDVGQQGEGQ